MSQAHLNTERLQALHDGEPGHRRELEHLASCPVCQEAFDDTRWTMLLMRLRDAEAEAGDHPDRDELLGFQTGALAMARHESIWDHLSRCRRCMAEFARTRAGRKHARYSSPPRKILQASMAQFRPRKLRRLGRLLVEQLEEGLALTFLKSRGPMHHVNDEASIAGTGLLGMAESRRHPASASRRVRRMRSVVREEAMDLEPDAYEMTGAAPHLADTLIEAVPWSLRIGSASDGSDDDLQVTLNSSDKKHSSAKVKLRVVPERGDESSAVTDASGVARLACPSGSSRMIVEVDPPLSIDVSFDD